MLLGLFTLGVSTSYAQELKLESDIVEFGDLKLGTTVNKTVKITNIGSAPLIIKSVVGSCGCTVPEYPTSPIAPGKSADIKLNYSVGTVPGGFNKTVTISSNDVKGSRKIFRIKGNAI